MPPEQAEEGGRLMADAGFPLVFVGVQEMRDDLPLLPAQHPVFGEVWLVGGPTYEVVARAMRERGTVRDGKLGVSLDRDELAGLCGLFDTGTGETSYDPP